MSTTRNVQLRLSLCAFGGFRLCDNGSPTRAPGGGGGALTSLSVCLSAVLRVFWRGCGSTCRAGYSFLCRGPCYHSGLDGYFSSDIPTTASSPPPPLLRTVPAMYCCGTRRHRRRCWSASGSRSRISTPRKPRLAPDCYDSVLSAQSSPHYKSSQFQTISRPLQAHLTTSPLPKPSRRPSAPSAPVLVSIGITLADLNTT